MSSLNNQYLGMVIKVSVSDMETSTNFYTNVLGGQVDTRYTISKEKQPNEIAYTQVIFNNKNNSLAFGLFNDIAAPQPKNPNGLGTVPTFIVDNIEQTKTDLESLEVTCSDIISNTSDEGYTDHFAFFNDPDNNVLALRENILP